MGILSSRPYLTLMTGEKYEYNKCSSPISVAISLLVTMSFPNLFPDILLDVSFITVRIPLD